MLYGTPEKSSVDFLLMILQNVGLHASQKHTYIFPDRSSVKSFKPYI
jgi:hypothetical protein